MYIRLIEDKIHLAKYKVMVLLITLFIGSFTSAATRSVDNGVWITDFKQAKKLSAKSHRPILASFSGSDWCHYCIKLRNEVFSKQEFITFAKKNFILLRIDFPQKTKLSPEQLKHNQQLAEKYKVNTFPAVMILDQNGNFILKTGYREGGCAAYISFLKIVKKLASIYSAEAIALNNDK